MKRIRSTLERNGMGVFCVALLVVLLLPMLPVQAHNGAPAPMQFADDACIPSCDDGSDLLYQHGAVFPLAAMAAEEELKLYQDIGPAQHTLGSWRVSRPSPNPSSPTSRNLAGAPYLVQFSGFGLCKLHCTYRL